MNNEATPPPRLLSVDEIKDEEIKALINEFRELETQILIEFPKIKEIDDEITIARNPQVLDLGRWNDINYRLVKGRSDSSTTFIASQTIEDGMATVSLKLRAAINDKERMAAFRQTIDRVRSLIERLKTPPQSF